MELELPLDGHGFLRRQCPSCEREFKWHHGPASELPADAPTPEEYFCPYCGGAAGVDEWWTEEQVEAIQAAAIEEVMPKLTSALEEAVAPLKKTGFLQTDVHFESTNPPPPLEERDDMAAVASPCHAYEPIKVASDWVYPIHCLVCGAPFVV
jgi:hypothetical protein